MTALLMPRCDEGRQVAPFLKRPPMTPPPITQQERRQRLARLEAAMETQGVAAVLIDATSSLRYFTGLVWSRSERMIAALVRPGQPLTYICPRFELDKVGGAVGVPGEFLTWE
ncbi:MAG: hypothetical protein EON96_16445, partial [Caulobacteraceae bacterium]